MDVDEIEVNLVQLLTSLSTSLDLTNSGVLQHHRRTALISLQLGEMSNLSSNRLTNLFKAAIIHDLGAVSGDQKFILQKFDVKNPWEHCVKGANLVAGIPDMAGTAPIIRSHHDEWKGNNYSGLSQAQIPLESRIIHLADRVDVLINKDEFILNQSSFITERIQNLSGIAFDPDLVDLFSILGRRESFWLDLTSPWLETHLISHIPHQITGLYTTNLSAFGELFARVVDAKSKFTYRHSVYVGKVTGILGQQAGLNKRDCYLLEVAGLLHDLGKLAVPESVLEKPGALTVAEMNIIKQHPYFTYWILKTVVPGLPIAKWAAYHHERIDGKGYPFGKSGEELDLPARIVAVADCFSALREDRPYRRGMDWLQLRPLLRKNVDSGAMDGEVVALLFSNRSQLDDQWFDLSTAS